jgi:hypothetical protein
MNNEIEHQLTLSENVQVYIEYLDGEAKRGLSPHERSEQEKLRKVVEVIVDDLVTSRETITESKLAGIESLLRTVPEAIERSLDDRFTRDVIDAVSGYVQRTMELSRLEGSRRPSKHTNVYLKEAFRTFVRGLPQASVALSRAALEQALKENIGYQGTGTFVSMNGLLDEAEGAGVIDATVRQMAREIADKADDVLHEKPTKLDSAYYVLIKLRGVLQHIYAED